MTAGNPAELGPELALLLACLRWPSSETAQNEIRSRAAAPLDWNQFLAWVDRHGAAPLVQRNLRLANPPALPAATAEKLHAAAVENTRRVLLQVAEAARITRRLAEAGIGSLVVKGPVLSLLAFGDPASRTSRDIDLLVEPAHAAEADRLLSASGYKRVDPEFALSPRQFDRYSRVRCQFGYRHENYGARLELHWRLTSNPWLLPVGEGALGRRPVAVRVADAEFATLPGVELFLYLCVHGSAHVWFRLKWLADIAALLQGMPAETLDRVALRASELGVERSFHQAMVLAAELLQAPVPPALLAEARADPAARSMAAAALKAIAWHGSPDEPAATRWFNTWTGLQAYRLKPGWRYRWAEFKDQVAAPEDWARLPLPDRLHFLYLPLRPLSWATRKLQTVKRAGG